MREDHGINIAKTRWLPIRYYDTQVPEGLIDKLFDVSDRVTRKQHNPVHPNANVVQLGILGVSHDNDKNVFYTYSLAYGYPNDGSCWYVGISAEADEPFYDFAYRAVRWLDQTCYCRHEVVDQTVIDEAS